MMECLPARTDFVEKLRRQKSTEFFLPLFHLYTNGLSGYLLVMQIGFANP